MGLSRQEYWSGLQFPSPWYLPNPGIEPRSPELQADALTSEPPGKPSLSFTFTVDVLINEPEYVDIPHSQFLILNLFILDCSKHLILLCLVAQSCPILQPRGQRSLVGYSPLGFSRQEYWSGLPCAPPGDLPNPRIKPRSSTLQADSLPSEPPGDPNI